MNTAKAIAAAKDVGEALVRLAGELHEDRDAAVAARWVLAASGVEPDRAGDLARAVESILRRVGMRRPVEPRPEEPG